MSTTPPKAQSLKIAYGQHSRKWREALYCYPVISRRSGGLSIGINLNPDMACNFDCIYCQVDRTKPPTVRKVELDVIDQELNLLLEAAGSGELFKEAPFDVLDAAHRRVCDIAFSGDGEPTSYPRFDDAVELAAKLRQRWGLEHAKLVLITDACYLTKPSVRKGLKILDANNGEIWAKLDAGTEEYYRIVNRPNYPLAHVMENIVDAARARPIVIQSLFMRVHGEPPSAAEIEAYYGRLNEILAAGGKLKLIQLYTIARRTTESYATMLTDAELDSLAAEVRKRVSIPIEVYYGVQ